MEKFLILSWMLLQRRTSRASSSQVVLSLTNRLLYWDWKLINLSHCVVVGWLDRKIIILEKSRVWKDNKKKIWRKKKTNRFVGSQDICSNYRNWIYLIYKLGNMRTEAKADMGDAEAEYNTVYTWLFWQKIKGLANW